MIIIKGNNGVNPLIYEDCSIWVCVRHDSCSVNKLNKPSPPHRINTTKTSVTGIFSIITSSARTCNWITCKAACHPCAPHPADMIITSFLLICSIKYFLYPSKFFLAQKLNNNDPQFWLRTFYTKKRGANRPWKGTIYGTDIQRRLLPPREGKQVRFTAERGTDRSEQFQ